MVINCGVTAAVFLQSVLVLPSHNAVNRKDHKLNINGALGSEEEIAKQHHSVVLHVNRVDFELGVGMGVFIRRKRIAGIDFVICFQFFPVQMYIRFSWFSLENVRAILFLSAFREIWFCLGSPGLQ